MRAGASTSAPRAGPTHNDHPRRSATTIPRRHPHRGFIRKPLCQLAPPGSGITALCYRIASLDAPPRHAFPSASRRGADPIVWIGLAKLAKAGILIFLASSLFREMHGDFEMNLVHALEHLRVDPDSNLAHRLIEKLTGIPHAHLRLIGIGTFLYAGLYLIEGVGLMLRKHWAEWLTTIGTTLFIPLEAYHLIHHFTWLKVFVMVVNFAIVWYLACRLLWEASARKKGFEVLQ